MKGGMNVLEFDIVEFNCPLPSLGGALLVCKTNGNHFYEPEIGLLIGLRGEAHYGVIKGLELPLAFVTD